MNLESPPILKSHNIYMSSSKMFSSSFNLFKNLFESLVVIKRTSSIWLILTSELNAHMVHQKLQNSLATAPPWNNKCSDSQS